MAYNPKTGKGRGRFYSAERRAFRAREWRGVRDTFYDFFRWLYLYGFMAAKLGCHPILMVKAMLRYRWMVSYLTASHMVDRHTMGLRGKELRYAHNQFFSVLHNSVLGVRDIIVRDENLRPNSKRAAKLRENTVMFDEMTPHLIMMGFPTVKWIDIAMFAVGLPSEVDQNASMFYIDAMEHLGLPADVCPEPAAECGVAVVDDYPRVGKCYFTGTMPCDGAISQTNILTRHFKGSALVPDHTAAACQRAGGADLRGQEPQEGHRISRAAVRRQVGLGCLLEKRRDVQRHLALHGRKVGRQLHRPPAGLRRGAGAAARI